MSEALIWGASGGIGNALVRHFKQNGWRVFAAARTLERVSPEADFMTEFDAHKPETFAQAARLIAQEVNDLKVVVYAAGGIRSSLLEKLSVGDWQHVIAANLTGVHLALQTSLDLVAPDGHLMAIGAYVDHITLPRMGAYTAAKAALEPLMTIYQKENRKLRFTLVRAPATATPFWENAPFKLPQSALQPETVAAAILQHHLNGGSGKLDLQP